MSARLVTMTMLLAAVACVPSTADPNPYGGIELRASLAPGEADPWTTTDGWTIELTSIAAPLFVGFASTSEQNGGPKPCTSGSFSAPDLSSLDLLKGPIVRVFRQVDVGPCQLVLVPGFAALDLEGTFLVTGRGTNADGRVLTFQLALGIGVAAYGCYGNDGQPLILNIENRKATHVDIVLAPSRQLRTIVTRGEPLAELDVDGNGNIDEVEAAAGASQLDARAVQMDVHLADGSPCLIQGR